MSDSQEKIGPLALGLFPEPNSLTYLLRELPSEVAENFADEILKGYRLDEAVNRDLRAKITMKIATVFYLGAKQEAMLIDQAISDLSSDSENQETSGLTSYYRMLSALCKDCVVYIRESVRKDNAHQGRMVQREEALKSAMELTMHAWENRFKKRPSYPGRHA